jgi:hypothetical protein
MIFRHKALDDSVDALRNRRDVLRGVASIGAVATVLAGASELLGAQSARAAAGSATSATQLPATMVLNALPPDAQAIRAAIEAGCCVTYTRDEGHCGAGGCGTGECCYHVTSPACALDQVKCVAVSCAEGNFTTGC